jgi:predicted RNase H-like nuclease
MTRVVGVDGAPGGWIAVVWDDGVAHHCCKHFGEVLQLAAEVIAVDMPIGLPAIASRRAEGEVRKLLGQRQSSVFSIPSRAAIMEQDYRKACAVALATSNPPRKIAKQAFNLFPKIREIDALMTPALMQLVHETHPELAFWVMNGEVPVPLAKKIKGATHTDGLALRMQLLAANGFPIADLPPADYLRKHVGADDLIDACACAWVARRILEKQSLCFPAVPELDARGLRMAIVA